MTNHKDALPIPGRRPAMADFSFHQRTEQPAEYYDGLFDSIADDSKVAAVMQFLLDRFITFNPKGTAPKTEAKRDMAERSQTDTAILMEDMLAEGRAPFNFDLVRIADIVDKIKENPARSTPTEQRRRS